MMSSKVRFFKKGHLPLFVNVHACPATYQGQDAIIVATTDISALVEKENQLIHASKMKSLGEMSAGMAHELNQPLNALKMGSDFLQMTIENQMAVNDDDLHQVVRQMSTQVDRAADIIVRLRAFGRKSDFRREPISINRSVQAAMRIIGHQLKLQDIDVEQVLDENLPAILAQPNRIEQVMFNLLSNARDAIVERRTKDPDAGRGLIRIRSFREFDRVVLTVRDNGGGIAESMRERIFEPFFTTKDPGAGMGLGLSILHGIITDYDGNIDFSSRPNRETTFKISFPAAPRPQGVQAHDENTGHR